MVRTSIIIPLYGGVELTKACHAALRSTLTHRHDVEIVYVDNASPDDTRAWLETLDGEATVVLLSANANFSGGCNRGVTASHGTNIVLLNNDTEVQPGWLEPLEERLAEGSVGIVGCLLTYPDGTVQHGGVTFGLQKMPVHTHVGLAIADPRVQQPRDMQAVTAACLGLRRTTWDQVGGLDEGYSNGLEDVDLCLRVRERGYRVTYEPRAVVVHHESKTAGRYAHAEPNTRRFQARFAQSYIPDDHFVDALVGVTDTHVRVARAEHEDGFDNAQLIAAIADDRVEMRFGGVTVSATSQLLECVGGVDASLLPGVALDDWLDRVALAGATVEATGAFVAGTPWRSSAVPALTVRWGMCDPGIRERAMALPFVDARQRADASFDVDRHARAVALLVPAVELEDSARRAFDVLAGTADELTLLVQIDAGDAHAFDALEAAAEHFDEAELPDVAIVESDPGVEVAIATTCESVLLIGSAPQQLRQRSIARAAGVPTVRPEAVVSVRLS